MGLYEGWKGELQPDRKAYGTERIYPDPVIDNVPIKESAQNPKGNLAKGYSDVETPAHKPYSKARDLNKNVGSPAHEVKGGQRKPNAFKAYGKIETKHNVEQQAK